MTSVRLAVPAIHCEACVARIIGAVEQVPGVREASGDAATRTIAVAYEPADDVLERIRRAVEASGFEVVQAEVAASERDRAAQKSRAELTGRAGSLLLPLAAVAAGSGLAVAGYLVGFLGYAYGLAVPQAFDRFSVSFVALVAGVASFFSPCVFPLLPGYVAQRAGALRDGPGRSGLAIAVAAAAGLTVANLALGAFIALVGAAAPFQPDPRQDEPVILAVRFVAGAFVVVLGVLALRGFTVATVLASLAGRVIGASAGRLSGRGTPSGTVGDTFLFGLTYHAAGLGCTGPILLSLMLYAVVSGQAVLAFAVFSLTMGGLMVAVTLSAGILSGTGIGRLAGAAERIERLGAIALVVAGTYTLVSLSTGPGRNLFVRTFLPFLP